MTTISLKIPEKLNSKLQKLAKRRGASKSQIVREALEGFGK